MSQGTKLHSWTVLGCCVLVQLTLVLSFLLLTRVVGCFCRSSWPNDDIAIALVDSHVGVAVVAAFVCVFWLCWCFFPPFVLLVVCFVDGGVVLSMLLE